MSAQQMPVSVLGDSGLSVSRLALGTMTFGVETEAADAFAQLDAYAAAGGTFLDTADVYGDGESERIVGRWLRERGETDAMVVATKGRFAPPPGSSGASRRGLHHAVEQSLDRLGRASIDLYFVHGWDEQVPVEQTLDTLTGLVRDGRIHHVGWSNVTGWQLQRIVTTARLGGYVVPCVVQPQYNLLDRGIETEVLPCCLDEGLSITPWSPLGGGWLTGKYRRDDRPTGDTRLGDDPERGVEAYDVRNNARTWRVLDVLERIADAHGRAMGQIAIAWLLRRPAVASVLLGARTSAQLDDNLGAIGIELSDAEVGELTEVSAPGLAPYPYGMLADVCGVRHWDELGTAVQPG